MPRSTASCCHAHSLYNPVGRVKCSSGCFRFFLNVLPIVYVWHLDDKVCARPGKGQSWSHTIGASRRFYLWFSWPQGSCAAQLMSDASFKFVLLVWRRLDLLLLLFFFSVLLLLLYFVIYTIVSTKSPTTILFAQHNTLLLLLLLWNKNGVYKYM